MQKTDEVERNVARWCVNHDIRCALTDLAGAWRLASGVRYQQSAYYIESTPANAVDGLSRELNAKRVDVGGNLILAVPSDPYVFYQRQTIGGIPIVSPLQLYLDLQRQPGRGEEAAHDVLDRTIVRTW